MFDERKTVCFQLAFGKTDDINDDEIMMTKFFIIKLEEFTNYQIDSNYYWKRGETFYSLLFTFYLLLVTFCSLFDTFRLLAVTVGLLFVAFCLLLVIYCFLFVTCYFLLFGRYFVLLVRYFYS